MKPSEFDYDLPPASIAQRPLDQRDASRMLLVDRRTGAWSDSRFRDFPDLLRGNELVVLNNARVLPARLFGHRAGLRAQKPGRHNQARHEFLRTPIEVLLIRQVQSDTWETLVRPGRKVEIGERIIFGEGELEAHLEARGECGRRVLRFASRDGFELALGRLGHIPLPPYIKREDEALDRERYQTVYARQGSAVAAPTAGLHFTPEVLGRLKDRGIEIAEVTLDVGLGTFEPVRSALLEDHRVDKEAYEISESAAAAIARAVDEKRPVLAVGTTVVRALEDAAEKNAGPNKSIASGRAEAEIFLYPGKAFRIVGQLLTNFHLPQSTLLALVAAFAGRENILRAYRHAVETGYRFYSYGDCMLIR